MATCGWALHALFIIYMVQGSPSPPGHGNGPQPPPLWISGPVVLYSIGPGPVTSGPVVLCSGLDTDLDPGLGPGLGPGRGPGLGSSQLQNQTCRPYYWGVGWGAPDPGPGPYIYMIAVAPMFASIMAFAMAWLQRLGSHTLAE